MAKRDEAIRAAARRHALSEGAIEALWDALVRGRGQAQFSHPDLGGMGQWSGGMLQIGDMFNTRLKSKVAAACTDLATQIGESSEQDSLTFQSQRQWQGTQESRGTLSAAPVRTSVPHTGFAPSATSLGQGAASERHDGWPSGYGVPASSGSQNGMRYAYFPERHRLVVHRDGRSTIYDTGPHRLFGVSQQQSRDRSLVFTSQDGTVGLESFVEIDS